ncbi:MAG: ImmA/IrrE family metallo-endopeptidase [Oscillospiraceae bacterium]|nr:ImmA/IrrE family metallo-endopeptidase [Oscillospiraceae bacterium]
MISSLIHSTTKKIVKRCDTRNPFKIAKELGVIVMWRDDFDKLKGMYKVILRNRFVFINRNLDEFEQRVICAHELGHDALHREIATAHFETALYDVKNRMEYEANAFAAGILIDDDEVIELISEGYDESGIASTLGVSVDLLLIKVSEMNKRGYNFALSRAGRGDFLKKT